MARNMNPTYLNKLRKIEKNGFTFDLANYLYNPAYGNDYPSFRKILSKSADSTTYMVIYYFKYYDGTGEYISEIYTAPNTDSEWVVTSTVQKTVLASANRFNLNTLLSFC